MGNGVSTDQGNLPTHGKRDARKVADTEQHDWSELAEAPITKQPNSLLSTTANSYISDKAKSLLLKLKLSEKVPNNCLKQKPLEKRQWIVDCRLTLYSWRKLGGSIKRNR